MSASPTYTVGTLSYTKQQLIVLFFWLMWNDFSLMLVEQVGNLNRVLMRDHGGTFAQMALIGSIGGFILPWINPWVSTWSDRHRSRFGRRRPFLFIAAPLFGVTLAATPFMPDLYHYLQRFPLAASFSSQLPMNGAVLFIGVCGIVCGMFNAVVLAIFSYLYWDVVPENLLGRFQSMSSNATLIAGLVWSFFVMGLAETHMKEVYVYTSFFCIAVYLISVWRIKEGGYPPPDVRTKTGFFAPIRAYFVECFSQSYFLWIFTASLVYQIGNQGSGFQFFYLREDLQLDLGVIGWTQGWAKLVTTGLGLSVGFFIGMMTDKLKPVRLMPYCYAALALVQVASYFYVHDKWTYLYSFCAVNVVMFVQGVVVAAFTVEVFPREKLGQFCSAQAVFYQVIINFINPVIGWFFDVLKNNRAGFLWSGAFYLLAGLVYVKVHANWRKRKGVVPAPRAG